MQPPKPKLTDIVKDAAALRAAWNTTKPAAEAGLLPPGWYIAVAEKGELFASRGGTPGYKLTLRVREPSDHAGRLIWHDLWLTEKALPNALRDLAKLGVTSPDQLEQPLPAGLVVKIRLATRKQDTGNECNEVRELHLHAIETPAAASSHTESPTTNPPSTATAAPWAVDLSTVDTETPPKGDDGTSFPFGANAEGGGT